MTDTITDLEHARGVAMFHKVFGPAYGEVLAGQLADDAGTIHRIAMTRIGPEIWMRDNADIRTKVLCAIAIFTAMGREEVKFFMRAAFIHGATRAEIEDIILLAGLEAGFPAATLGAKRLAEAEAEHAAFTGQQQA
jgi:alkylhydroperoxidase/carboxymuconolactone decarboxylase family protein YurZ